MRDSNEFEVVWEMVQEYVDVAIQEYVLEIVSPLVVEHLPSDEADFWPGVCVNSIQKEGTLRDKIKSLLEDKR